MVLVAVLCDGAVLNAVYRAVVGEWMLSESGL